MTINIRSLIIGIVGVALIFYLQLLRIEPTFFVQQLMQKFQLSAAQYGLISSAHYTAYLLILLPAGLLLDIFEPLLIILLATLLAFFGNIIFAETNTLTYLMLGLTLMGIAGALTMLGIFKMGVKALPQNNFILFTGIVLAVGTFISFFGFPFLKTLNLFLSWQHSILIVNIIGIFALLLILLTFIIKNYPKEESTIISMDEIIAIFKNYKIWITSLVAVLGFLFFSFFIPLTSVPFLRQNLNFSAKQAASLTEFAFFGFVLGAIVAAVIAIITTKRRGILIPGYVLAAFLFFTLFFLNSPAYGIVALLLFLIGFCVGVNILCYVLIADYTQKSNFGFAFGLFSLLNICGTVLLMRIGGGFAINPVTGDFNWGNASLVVPICLLIASLLAIFLPRDKKINTHAKTNIFKELSLYLNGKGKLGRAFWLIYILGTVLVSMFMMAFIGVFPHGFTLVNILLIPYLLYASVCVWRCANNTTWWPGFKYIARVIVLFVAIIIVLGLIKLISPI